MAAPMKIAFLLLCGLTGTQAGKVLELSDRFLDVYKDGIWMVMFYAPWCGHCKKLEPTWSHVAQSLHFSQVRVARVDCTRFSSVATHFSIKGFPTILFIKGETILTYKGDRIREEMVDFALRMSGPPVINLQDCDELRSLPERHNVFFLLIGGEGDTELWTKYYQVAEVFQSTNFFYRVTHNCLNEEADPQSKSEPSEIYVYKDGARYKFPGIEPSETEAAALRHAPHEDHEDMPPPLPDLNATLMHWVNQERFPRFIKITNGNFNQLLQTGKYIVIAVLEENKIEKLTDEMEKFKSLLQSVCEKHQEKYHKHFQFGWVGSPSLANSVAMEKLPVPGLLVVNSNTYHHHLPDDDPLNFSAENITSFLDQIVNKSAPAYGGASLFIKAYRLYYEATTSLKEMWRGNPVLTAVLFGLPMGFLSLICYSICCADILDATEEDELQEQGARHEKRE